jgi:hypothetical protein
MATTTEVGIKITVDGSQPEKSVGSIKSQLKQANAELIAMRDKFGDTSVEAVNAAKKVANLKDSIGDAKAMADGFNPDAKFKAFGSALQGVAGGFSALQGAQALFGSESKDLEKTLVKVQSAMALSQGLNSVLEARDSFKNLGAVVRDVGTKAFGSLRSAIISTGIGALVIAVGLLVANFDKVKKVVLDLIPGLASVGTFISNIVNSVTDFVGVTSKASRELEKFNKLTDQQLKEQNAFLDQNGYKYDEYTNRKIKANIDYLENAKKVKNDETLSEAQKNKALKDFQDKRDFEINQSTKDRQAKVDEANAQEVEKEKTKNDKLVAEAKAKNDALKKQNEDFEKELQALKDKNFTDAIKDENDKAEALLNIQFTNDIKALNSSTLNEEQKNSKRIELGKQYQIQIDEINANRDAIAQKELDDAQAKELERIAKNNEQRKKDYEKKEKDDAEATAKEKKLSEERIATAQAERDAKIAIYESIANSLGQLADIIGKDTEAGKGFAIAQLVISQALAVAKIVTATKTANAGALATPQAILTGGTSAIPTIAFNNITAGISIASSIASVVKGIQAIRGANKSSGGGGASASASLGGGTVSPPLPPQLATQTINAGQINQLASATARAYVVESDVSGNQERINRLNRASRIN